MSAFDPKRTYNIYSTTSSAWPSSDSRIVLLPQLPFLLFSTGVWRAKGGAPIMDVRIVAILVGFAITFIQELSATSSPALSDGRSARTNVTARRSERPIREITERFSGVKRTLSQAARAR
jgi:hypothetical protein